MVLVVYDTFKTMLRVVRHHSSWSYPRPLEMLSLISTDRI